MPVRGDICQPFNSRMFRFYLRRKYKRPATFAKRMGVSVSAVYRWLAGDSKPTWRHLIEMAEILKIAPRLLIAKTSRHVLDKWEDHLLDYLSAPPEIKHEKRVTLKSEDGSSETEKTVKRELKLTTKEAIELSERLGYFEDMERADAAEPVAPDAATQRLHELTDELTDEEP